MLTYTIPKHRRGDTWDGISSIGIKVNGAPVNLSGSLITMEFREDYDSPVALTFSTATSTIIIQPSLSSIKIPPIKITIPPATYKYDLQIIYPDSTTKTYMEGSWQIYFDVTK
jgi:hypothetical protein